MARKLLDNCVGCTSMGLYCRGSACPNSSPIVEYTCDKCGTELDPEDLYDVDGDMLCAECILNEYKTIAQIEEDEMYADNRD